MSLIVRTFTDDGFVIAADGLESGANNPSDRPQGAQKIFPAESQCGTFALSIAGAISIAADDRRGYAVDILDQALESVERLRERRTASLMGYAIRLPGPIHAAMKEAVMSGKLARYPTLLGRATGERGATIAIITLDGYHNGRRSSVNIQLFHEDGVLAKPYIFPEELETGLHCAYGSEVIGLLLFESGEEVEAMLKTLPEATRLKAQRIMDTHRPKRMYISDVMTIATAIDRSRRYIEACSDPDAVTLGEGYDRIGGRIHIATVTPKDGFQWVAGYEPATLT
jgi:hypothetical protein